MAITEVGVRLNRTRSKQGADAFTIEIRDKRRTGVLCEVVFPLAGLADLMTSREMVGELTHLQVEHVGQYLHVHKILYLAPQCIDRFAHDVHSEDAVEAVASNIAQFLERMVNEPFHTHSLATLVRNSREWHTDKATGRQAATVMYFTYHDTPQER